VYSSAGLVHYLARSSEGIFVNNNRDYWKANLRLLGILLSIWFIVSFGFGILLVDQLNQIPFFGFKLGFWWAQQGSIYVFVILIFAYIHLMQKLDRKFGVSDEDDTAASEAANKEDA
jgi:putative solute:sodium symporter small subunit